MLRKPVSPNKIKLDPVFTIPAGAEDLFVYTRDASDSTDGTDDSETDTLELSDDVDITDAGDSSSEFALDTPDTLTLISETLRRASGGQQVVDVVLGIDEVDGALDYEIQVVKI